MFNTRLISETSVMVEGVLSRYFAPLSNAEIFLHINGNSQIMTKLVCLLKIKKFYYSLLLRMARMEKDCISKI